MSIRRARVRTLRTINGAVFTVFVKDYARFVQLGGQEYVMACTVELWNRIRARTPRDRGDAATSWRYEVTRGYLGRIYSDLVYMPVLEFGQYRGLGPKTVAANGGIFSKQAPRGMVRLTLSTFPQIASRVARDLGLVA